MMLLDDCAGRPIVYEPPPSAVNPAAGGELFGFFDATVQEANTWLAAICDELNVPNRRFAFHALRGVLFALRDRLTAAEALDLAAQLPLLVRGVFAEGYRSKALLAPLRGRDEFFRRVEEELSPISGTNDTNPEAATRAVLNVIEEHVSRCGCIQVQMLLPRALHGLWA